MGRHGETLEKTPEIMSLGDTGWHHEEVWTKTERTDKDMTQNKRLRTDKLTRASGTGRVRREKGQGKGAEKH